ncbi:hypothetical protein KSS87_015221 [Heliosperma pusillum]|nr:hypothetical protein KSS87_015221 [Heliosperma pusillum]
MEFVPEHIRSKMRGEFERFKMKVDMSLEEYHNQFMELSTYVADLKLSPKILAVRFDKGLTLDILKRLPVWFPNEVRDVREVYLRAKYAERLTMMTKDLKKERGEKRKVESISERNENNGKKGGYTKSKLNSCGVSCFSGGCSYGGGVSRSNNDSRGHLNDHRQISSSSSEEMAMARAMSGLAYPERFYAAASYAGFSAGSPDDILSKFTNEAALLLFALYQQATVGPCNVSKPSAWKPVEVSKWSSWSKLGNMASAEAMRLFVKILEEEDPGWYSRADAASEPVVDVQMNHNSIVEAAVENGNAYPETKEATTANGRIVETQDKDVVSEGLGPVSVYDQWDAPPISGQRPKPRYEHGAAVVGDKLYVYGGNHNGRYLNDLQALDLRAWTWSRVEVRAGAETPELQSSAASIPCAGHALIPWENKLLSVAGHTKDPSETIQGSSLVIFGGENANRSLLNDLHLLDLETMTWDEFEAAGVPPSPRSDHTAAVHAGRYLLIFGGGSHAACFNDLHVLDLQAMEWSRPTQQGDIPSSRAGHAGVAIGENWFIVGGGDNKSGAAETVVLNMSTLVWSIVTSVKGRVSLASEGLSLVVASHHGEEILVSFGGYNGRYNNEVHVLKPSLKSTSQSNMSETPVPDSVSAVHNATNPSRNFESELDAGQGGKIREIVMDTVDSQKIKAQVSGDGHVAVLKKEKEDLDSELSTEKLQNLQLKQELAEAESRSADLHKELQSVRSQLASEQSRCFKLEVDVAELRQKLQTMEQMEKEIDILRRQKAASEQAALSAKQRQSSGGVWGWLAPAPTRNFDSKSFDEKLHLFELLALESHEANPLPPLGSDERNEEFEVVDEPYDEEYVGVTCSPPYMDYGENFVLEEIGTPAPSPNDNGDKMSSDDVVVVEEFENSRIMWMI